MASEGTLQARNKAVAEVAGKLFGATVKPENIITETLQRQTPHSEKPIGAALTQAIQAGSPDTTDFKTFSVHFCRQCGQEYHPVRHITEEGVPLLSPRDIDDRSHEEGADFGFFMFDPDQNWNDADPDKYPENWIEEHKGGYRVKSNFNKFKPKKILVKPNGLAGYLPIHR